MDSYKTLIKKVTPPPAPPLKARGEGLQRAFWRRHSAKKPSEHISPTLLGRGLGGAALLIAVIGADLFGRLDDRDHGAVAGVGLAHGFEDGHGILAARLGRRVHGCQH